MLVGPEQALRLQRGVAVRPRIAELWRRPRGDERLPPDEQRQRLVLVRG